MGEPLEYYGGGRRVRRSEYPGLKLRVFVIPVFILLLVGIALASIETADWSDLFELNLYEWKIDVQQLLWIGIAVLGVVWLASLSLWLRNIFWKKRTIDEK